MDFDLLIYSSASGHPDPTHRLGHRHWCRFTDNPRPHTVAQMRAGGQFPGSDCGDALILARLLDDGNPQPMRIIEREAWTGAGGTVGDGMVAAYAANGLRAHWQDGRPPRLPGMNPAWGGIIPVEQFDVYLASSTGGGVVVDTPGWWEGASPASAAQPITTGTAISEDDMAQADIDAINAHIDSVLATKLTFLAVPAGKCLWLPGAEGASQVNLCAQDSDTGAVLITYGLDGTPRKARTFALQGNKPGVRGPVQQYCAVRDVDDSDDPVLVAVWNQGPGDLIAAIH